MGPGCPDFLLPTTLSGRTAGVSAPVIVKPEAYLEGLTPDQITAAPLAVDVPKTTTHLSTPVPAKQAGTFARVRADAALTGLFAVGVIFIAPAWLDRRALLLMVAWDLVIAVLITINLRRLTPAAGVHVIRTWSAPLTIGSPSEVCLDLHNHGAGAIAVRVTDYVSGQLRRDLPEIETAIPPRALSQVSYASRRQRADMTTGCGAARLLAWGLVDRWASSAGAIVRVYPAWRRAPPGDVSDSQPADRDRERRAKRFGVGRDFEEPARLTPRR